MASIRKVLIPQVPNNAGHREGQPCRQRRRRRENGMQRVAADAYQGTQGEHRPEELSILALIGIGRCGQDAHGRQNDCAIDDSRPQVW